MRPRQWQTGRQGYENNKHFLLTSRSPPVSPSTTTGTSPTQGTRPDRFGRNVGLGDWVTRNLHWSSSENFHPSLSPRLLPSLHPWGCLLRIQSVSLSGARFLVFRPAGVQPLGRVDRPRRRVSTRGWGRDGPDGVWERVDAQTFSLISLPGALRILNRTSERWETLGCRCTVPPSLS